MYVIIGCERWQEDEMIGRESFLEDLKLKINDINFDKDSLNLSACDQKR